MERITKYQLKSMLEDVDNELAEAKQDGSTLEQIRRIEGQQEILLELLGGRPEDMRGAEVVIRYHYLDNKKHPKTHHIEIFKDDEKYDDLLYTSKKKVFDHLRKLKGVNKEQMRTLNQAMTERRKDGVWIEQNGTSVQLMKQGV